MLGKLNGCGRCFDIDSEFVGSPNGLFVREDGVEEPDFEGTGGGGGEGFDSHCWEEESWFMVVLVGGVPAIERTWFEFVTADVASVESSKSLKPQASSVESFTGDTIDELDPLDIWRIGC